MPGHTARHPAIVQLRDALRAPGVFKIGERLLNYAISVSGTVDFAAFVARKTREAADAAIQRLSTRVDTDIGAAQRIGNAWSRDHYDGDFKLCRSTAAITVSLVFVQTSDGNTGAADPSTLGGGATDTHLIYNGLTRVAADAVLAGAGTLHPDSFFSVWRPELVALRASLNLPRHPAQVVVSKRGRFDINTRLFNVPDVPVFLLAGDDGAARHAADLQSRPWIRLIRMAGDDIRSAVDDLQNAGIRRISAIGGPATATQLVDAGRVQDIYLTTTSRTGGDPHTPWYSGARSPRLTHITAKTWTEGGSPIRFDHFLITNAR